MEQFIALCVMIPAAAADLKYRTVSLESCVAAFLAGCAVFVLWATTASTADIIVSGTIGGSACIVTLITRKMMGSGDWWFAIGIMLVICTIHPLAVLGTLLLSVVPLLILHCIICVRRTDLPFPQRLCMYRKQSGDKFSVDITSGKLLDTNAHDILVKPGLPMITFMVIAAIIVGIVFTV